MKFDLSKLRGRIIEKHGTLREFARKMNWSERTNSLKVNGIIEWKQSEILLAGELLDIASKDIDEYFFNIWVQDFELNDEMLCTHY